METQTKTICESNMEEFNKPVESIMRCENFKSNFARRLSNRYTSKSPNGLKADSTMTLHLVGSVTEQSSPTSPVPSLKEFRQSSPISAVSLGKQPPKVTDTVAATSNTNCVEVTALTMEVETLRWQLAQTETNRQMHLALLQQIVSFLNRVKEHMVCQSSELNQARRENYQTSAGVSPKPLDLPRSRSVLHVSRNQEFSLSPVKKLTTRKMSKSISNVNGLRDLPWNESKLSLNQEKDAADKIVQEISRLISLANSVLSTKIPDLSYSCNEVSNSNHEFSQKLPPVTNGDGGNYDSDKSANNNNVIAKSNECEINSLTKVVVSDNTNAMIDCDSLPNATFNSEFPIMSDLGCKLSMVRADDGKSSPPLDEIETIEIKSQLKNGNYGHVTSYIEDESGFSSMSSFQEIGIPIINIIPPTPCKDISFSLRDLELMDGAGDNKWKPGALELDKHTMQVFWV